jgi:hypothetical protein
MCEVEHRRVGIALVRNWGSHRAVIASPRSQGHAYLANCTNSSGCGAQTLRSHGEGHDRIWFLGMRIYQG